MTTEFVRKVTDTLVTHPDVAVACVVTVSMRPDGRHFEMDVSIRGGTMTAETPILLEVARERLKSFCDHLGVALRELADEHLKHPEDDSWHMVDDSERPGGSKKAKA